MIIATHSPFFKKLPIRRFWHKGCWRDYAGSSKDLAIVKYCATGLLDQDENFRFLVDEMRTLRYARGDPPMSANPACMVTLVTTDSAHDMSTALDEIFGAPVRAHFTVLRFSKVAVKGLGRLAHVGQIVGSELRKRFIRVERGGLVLDL